MCFSDIKTDVKLLLECMSYQKDNPSALKQALVTISSILQSFSKYILPHYSKLNILMLNFIIPNQVGGHGSKIFQYFTCPAATYNFHSSCKHMHLSFKIVCNKEHKGVMCNMTPLSNSAQTTRPSGRLLREELLVLSRVHS